MEDEQYIRENYEIVHGWIVGEDLVTAEGISKILENPSEYEIDRTLDALAASEEIPVERTGYGDNGRSYDTSEFDNEAHREVVKHFFP